MANGKKGLLGNGVFGGEGGENEGVRSEEKARDAGTREGRKWAMGLRGLLIP